MTIKRLPGLLVAVLTGLMSAQAQTEQMNTWIELEFRKDFLKKLEFSLTPEVRLKEQFQVDEYLLQAQLGYELFPFLEIAGAYRISEEVKRSRNEVYHRYAFDVQAKKEIQRFEASFRGRLTNYSEASFEDPGTYFRPRAKVEYDVKNNKIRPFVSYELFRNLSEKAFHKWRFDAGFTRDLGKIHRVGLYYRLHDYFTDKDSVHILGIEYRIKI